MDEIARVVGALLLVVLAYGVGEYRGRAQQAELALRESAAVVADLERKSAALVAAERRISELQSTASAAGTRTRTVIRDAADLGRCPVPEPVSAGLRAQMARTARFGTLAGDGSAGGDGSR